MLCTVRSDQIDQLPGGGQCIVKQYIQYTHLCTVNNYLPNVDYCCCAHERRLFCCRYHQDWYHFRCMESEDVIEDPYDCLMIAFMFYMSSCYPIMQPLVHVPPYHSHFRRSNFTLISKHTFSAVSQVWPPGPNSHTYSSRLSLNRQMRVELSWKWVGRCKFYLAYWFYQQRFKIESAGKEKETFHIEKTRVNATKWLD